MERFVEKIEKNEEEFGSLLRHPASDSEIIKINQNIQQKFGNIVLPDSYLEFLKIVNGIDFNGLVIYGVDKSLLDKDVDEEINGFIETNEIWYENEWQKRYVFFGDSDVALYCYDTEEGVYVEFDKPSGTLMQTFNSFDSMLTNALETAL